MAAFDHIAIVYNPSSTGNARKIAKDLAESVDGYHEIIKRKATLYPTKYAGHAIEIAESVATKYDRPLIVSVSGDGGYNEVVNGAMHAKKSRATANPVVAVAAAGNANDHKRVMRGDTPLIRLIKRAESKPMDLISITASAKDFSLQRYAHSYIGFGITSEVGHALNHHGKGIANEIRVTLQTIGQFTPSRIERDGKEYSYDNLVFANINEMAKVVKFDPRSSVHDNKFEVIAVKHRGKLHLIRSLMTAVMHGFRRSPRFSTYSFTTIETQPVQCDGEIEEIVAGSRVTIKSHGDAIESLF